MRGIKNKLSKDTILSKVSQEEIFAKYLQIDIDTIHQCSQYGYLIESPLRVDEDPSFGFRYNNKGKLKARDFSGYFWGDCFDLVAYMMSKMQGINYDVSKKSDFYAVLKNIAITFKHKIYSNSDNGEVDASINRALRMVSSTKHIIECVPREYNLEDSKIWSKWGLTGSDLIEDGIYAVEQYYIDRYCQPEPKYYYTKDDPCYVYVLGVDERGIYNIKLYFPRRKKGDSKPRFITNSNIIEGIHNVLPNSDIIIITESTKDRVAIKKFCNTFPLRGDITLSVCNYPAASYRMNDSEYRLLHNKLNENGTIISLFDFDQAGRRAAKDLEQRYNIPYMFIPNGEFGLPNYGAKDFCELLEQYSSNIILDMLNETLQRFIY